MNSITSHGRGRMSRVVAVAALALAGLAVAPPLPASAATPAFQLPFPCGQKWQLNSWGHAPALDMVKEPDQTGTNGALLIAPAAGTVKQSFYHSNAGNMIQIDHGGGHFTTYIHLQSRAVSVGQKVQQGQAIGRVGATGPTSNGTPHLHYEQAYDANHDGYASWGEAGSERVIATFNGVQYGQANNREWNNVTSANGCETAPREGAVYREPDGSIAVIAGGAAVPFLTMAEVNAAGYGNAVSTAVPAGWIRSQPSEPRDGTFLRNNADSSVYVVAGGAKYGLSYEQFVAMGKPASVNVPVRVIDGYGTVPGNGTYLRNPADSSVYVVAGGAKYGLSYEEYSALGKPASANVPVAMIDQLGAVPSDGTYLRNPADSSIYVVAGGARYGLSYDQWNALGKPASTNVPIGFVNTLAREPKAGTYLRNAADSSVYLTVGGARYGLSYPEYQQLGSPKSTNVPIEWINTFGAIPRDGSYLRDVADDAIYTVTGGKKRALTNEQWEALGKPATTTVPTGLLTKIPDA
ncbi:hypothetical protein Sru01_40340 [Sphaerisporangium rufum]|uniref:M23ase beta-sheet core domain-containing protein n=1 Tax=Sphaerisporangium rufum TaxID=1381558 RepID=A0A919R3K6_9ACTN|nr:M23 family metallopeptidase [Sphaerisporangium rufum]GII79052.1 hypothetical protein Sru01_40340 [Sphaerisporangium rufum]